MSLQSVLIDKIKQLPEDQQMLVKSLVDELARHRGGRGPGKSGEWFGALEHLGVEISDEDIAEARQEMWGNFPREIEPLTTDQFTDPAR